jgi:hypothetical protein
MAFIDWGRWSSLNKDKGEEMAQKTLDESSSVFGQAETELNKAAHGREYDTSAIGAAEAKRRALRSIGSDTKEAKGVLGGSVFDRALVQGSQTMGNAYSQMGDYQKRLDAAKQQGQAWTQRQDETARKHALAQMAQTKINQDAMAKWDAARAQAGSAAGQEERFMNHTPLPGESDEYYEWLNGPKGDGSQGKKKQKSIWEFFGR